MSTRLAIGWHTPANPTKPGCRLADERQSPVSGIARRPPGETTESDRRSGDARRSPFHEVAGPAWASPAAHDRGAGDKTRSLISHRAGRFLAICRPGDSARAQDGGFSGMVFHEATNVHPRRPTLHSRNHPACKPGDVNETRRLFCVLGEFRHVVQSELEASCLVPLSATGEHGHGRNILRKRHQRFAVRRGGVPALRRAGVSERIGGEPRRCHGPDAERCREAARDEAKPHQNGREIARRAAQSAAGKLAFVPLKANGTDKGKGFARAAWPWRSALRAGGA